MSTQDEKVIFVPLKDIATSAKGKKPSVLERESRTGYLPYIDIEAFEKGVFKQFTKPEKIVTSNEGDVLMVWDGSRSGFVGRGRKGALGSTLVKIDVPLVEKTYLFHFLEALYPKINSRAKGVGIPHVDPNLLWSSQFPVVSQKQQHLIVEKIEELLSEVEASIKDLESAQKKLKLYRASVLNAACSGKLISPKTAWPQRQISTVIQTIVQGWSPKCENGPSDNNATWGVIKTTAVQSFHFVEVENKKLPSLLTPRQNIEIQPGDILVTRAGPRNRVGIVCLVKSTRPRLMLCDKVYRLRCKEDVLPAFLELVLNAPRVVSEIGKLKTGISDSGVNLTQIKFGELLIPIPPLPEQTSIVEEVERRLSIIDEIEDVLSVNLMRATRLRQSILEQAFSGKLVPQDPNDEPASVVLEKIKAEREKAVSTKKALPKVARGRKRAKKA